MERVLYILLATTLFSCSSDPAPAVEADSETRTDIGTDAEYEPDTWDAGVPDVEVPDLGGSDTTVMPSCADHSPAACMADPACTLDDGCVRRNGAEPFRFLRTGAWIGTAQITEQNGLPGGTTDVILTLHRDNDRDVRGIATFPEHDIDHVVWGGVGPTGELGLYFGSPRCAAGRCADGFGPAYDVGGVAGDLDIALDAVVVDESVTSFQTFIDMQLSPSDGFKPVGPIFPRADVLAARWMGDMLAVDESGALLDLHCNFEVAPRRDGGHQFTDFGCSNNAPGPAADTNIDAADDSTIAYANGLAWFATGPDADDLAFIGRAAVETPWEGVVARRGDLLDGGVPIDPEDVPFEAVRGTFQFYAFNNSE